MLPRSPPGDFPNLGIEPTTLMSPALAGRFFTISATWEAQVPMGPQIKRPCQQEGLEREFVALDSPKDLPRSVKVLHPKLT